MTTTKTFRVEIDGQRDEPGRILERQWEEQGTVIDWAAFPQGYGILFNERLMFPGDMGAWRMKISTTRQLFIDDHVIAHKSNLKRQLHNPKSHPANPLFDSPATGSYEIPIVLRPDPEQATACTTRRQAG
jgi:hypothetical protein